MHCGDKKLDTDPLEECDDGNSVADDGCTNCMIDLGWKCERPNPDPTVAEASVCTKQCGDGVVFKQ